MTSSSILKLITDEQLAIARKRNGALARGNWIKAAACDEQDIVLTNLKKRIVEVEDEEGRLAQERGDK